MRRRVRKVGSSSWTTAARSRPRRWCWQSATSRRKPLGIAAGLGERFVNNPWNEEAKAAVREAAASGGDVLLVGTGLTMIDAVLSLDAAGHQGRIVALSRRGQIPKAHADFDGGAGGRERGSAWRCAGAVALAAAAERRGGMARGGGFAAAAQPRPVAGPGRRAAAAVFAPRPAVVGRAPAPDRARGRAAGP